MKKRVYLRSLNMDSEPVYEFGSSQPGRILTRITMEVEFVEPLESEFISALQKECYIEAMTDSERENRKGSVAAVPYTDAHKTVYEKLKNELFKDLYSSKDDSFSWSEEQEEEEKSSAAVKEAVHQKPKRMIQTEAG